jgi:hypothetical protein
LRRLAAQETDMAAPITINVTNGSLSLQNFFFFQQPAHYSASAEVFTNSLYTAPLLPSSTSGAMLSFTPILQVYAGVQQQVKPPQVGQLSGLLSAMQPIAVAPPAGAALANDTTTMTVSPSLGLSVAASSTPGPPAGSFRIVVPTFNPVLAKYNAGLAVQSISGQIILSNFVTAQPTSNLDCQPAMIFYVATGSYGAGTVINFAGSTANAAKCDATPGFTTFNVTYNADGTWSVQSLALVRLSDGRQVLVARGLLEGAVLPR